MGLEVRGSRSIVLCVDDGSVCGCPGDSPNSKWPNWVTCPWPPDYLEILKWQWEERLLPYWRSLTAAATKNGVERLCVELHGNQLVYNVPALLRLRHAVGPVVGANLDPSHLMWMGADPLAAIRALGDAIYHVHAKDTRVEPATAGLNGRLDYKPANALADRLLKVLANPEMATQMGIAGRRRAREIFTWPAAIDRMLAVMQR